MCLLHITTELSTLVNTDKKEKQLYQPSMESETVNFTIFHHMKPKENKNWNKNETNKQTTTYPRGDWRASPEDHFKWSPSILASPQATPEASKDRANTSKIFFPVSESLSMCIPKMLTLGTLSSSSHPSPFWGTPRQRLLQLNNPSKSTHCSSRTSSNHQRPPAPSSCDFICASGVGYG